MASQFCMKCGKPLPAEAQFCSACGTPIQASSPVAPAPTPGGAPPGPPAPPPAAGPPTPAMPGAPPLGTTLGVNGSKKFLLQHELFSGGHNYRVLNHEKKHLFTVREDVRQELMANVLNRAASPPTGLHFGFVAPPTRTHSWVVADSFHNPQGSISIQETGNSAVSTLADSSGTPVLAVNVQRSMIGGLSATAAYPDGRAMFRAHGNILRHNFSIQDPNGTEVAKIHEGWASVRGTYNLDLVGDVDPLCPLIFAILIDREKAE